MGNVVGSESEAIELGAKVELLNGYGRALTRKTKNSYSSRIFAIKQLFTFPNDGRGKKKRALQDLSSVREGDLQALLDDPEITLVRMLAGNCGFLCGCSLGVFGWWTGGGGSHYIRGPHEHPVSVRCGGVCWV